MTNATTSHNAIILEDPDPLEALRTYWLGYRCVYLGEIYRQPKAKMDADQVA